MYSRSAATRVRIEKSKFYHFYDVENQIEKLKKKIMWFKES